MFSIIVPMYNIKQYAKTCIDSIIHQTYEDFEIIIVDDGSTDGTGEIIDYYAKEDKRINVIHKGNGGLVSARKAGAELASGEYVIIIDGDDWIDADYIKDIADAIDSSDPDVVICGYTKSCDAFEEEKQYSGLKPGVYLANSDDFVKFKNYKLIYASPTLWAKCFKRAQYIEAQQKIEDWISIGEDGCVSYPLLAAASKITVIPNCGYHYRFNPTSLTRSKAKIVPFYSAIWRIKHLKKELPSSIYIDRQVAAFAGHALFNVVLTNMRFRKYREVVREAKEHFADCDISYYLGLEKITGTKKEIVFHIILKYKLFFLIKLYLFITDRKG